MHLEKTSAAVFATAGLFTLTACGSALQSDDVEETMVSELEEAGLTEEEFDVDCSGDIDAEVDEQMNCTVAFEDEDIPDEQYLITITDVDDEDVYYDIVPENEAEQQDED